MGSDGWMTPSLHNLSSKMALPALLTCTNKLSIIPSYICLSAYQTYPKQSVTCCIESHLYSLFIRQLWGSTNFPEICSSKEATHTNGLTTHYSRNSLSKPRGNTFHPKSSQISVSCITGITSIHFITRLHYGVISEYLSTQPRVWWVAHLTEKPCLGFPSHWSTSVPWLRSNLHYSLGIRTIARSMYIPNLLFSKARRTQFLIMLIPELWPQFMVAAFLHSRVLPSMEVMHLLPFCHISSSEQLQFAFMPGTRQAAFIPLRTKAGSRAASVQKET